jgi:hypothetical protein
MGKLTEFFSWTSNSDLSGLSTRLMQTNIIRHGGGYTATSGGDTSDFEAVNPDCNTYTQYLFAIDRLRDYRNHEIAETILDLFQDAVFANIDQDTENFVTIKDDPETTKLINKDLSKLDLIAILKSSFKDGIYYGSNTSGLKLVGKDYEIKKLINPYSVVQNQTDHEFYIQGRSRYKSLKDVVRFSLDNLELSLDGPILDDLHMIQHEDEFYETDRLITGRPLFLSTELKVKEYVTKDLMISLLSLMRLIEQDTWTIDVQRLSDMDSVIELCEQVKDLIVTKDDMNILTSARLDKSVLIRRLFDRTRVVPSIANNLQGMQLMQGDKLVQRIQELKSDKETLREEILTAVGFPRDLYSGSTTKWDAARQDDRYSMKTTYYKDAVSRSVIQLVLTLCRLRKKKIDPKKITLPFIKETSTELNNLVQRIEANSGSIRALSDIIDAATNMSRNDSSLNKKKLNLLIKKMLGNIDSDLSDSYFG